MLLKKLFRTIRLYKAQFISMIIMVALGIGIFVGFNMEWYSIEQDTGDFFSATGYADYRIVSADGFTRGDALSVAGINGVDRAARFVSLVMDVKGPEKTTLSVTVTEDISVSGIYLVSGQAYSADDKDGIWLSDRFAALHDIETGDDITLTYGAAEIKATVRGLIKSGEYLVCVRDETQLMPDFATHAFAYISPAAYEAAGGAFYPQIHAISGLGESEFSDKAAEALGMTVRVISKENAASYSAASGESEEGKTMGSVLPVLFLLIGVLTMVTTMHRLVAQEKTQIGFLKALGFKDRRIKLHYTSYAVITGIIGTAIGLALGYGIAYMVMNPNGMMGTYMDLPEWKLCFPVWCIYVIAAILLLLTLVGYLSVCRMLRGTAADALRPYVPAEVKPMLIERTKWFHRLPFGTRWNLRDMTRHKARTLMSLIGTVGCMVLIVGSLGMGDTMNAFLDTYYNKATLYSSRIYFSEDADKSQREAIRLEYDGDASASIGIRLNDDTVSLDIYDITHGLVRFPNREGGFTVPAADGAYVCLRLADKYGITAGDELEIRPFGTDDVYRLRISGVIRSVSECVVMSAEYASSIGIPYTYDSVYTSAAREDIAAHGAIKSVQSKQMIVDSFDSFLEIMNMMIYILIAGALLLGTVVLYDLGVMSYSERYREMATLKVVGFRDRKIGMLLTEQNILISVVGIIIGIPAGIGALYYLVTALAGEYEMNITISALTIVISILLTVGMSLLVSLMVSRKNRQINMTEALKCAE